MSDYKTRVLDEYQSLNDKINKLERFLKTEYFEELPDEDKKLLEEQLRHMSNYSVILSKRILRFSNE